MKSKPFSNRSAEYSPADARQISRVLVNQVERNKAIPVSSFVNHFDPSEAARHDINLSPRHEAEDQVPHIPLDRRDDGPVELDELDRESLREVYLFDCCGLTRELRPAHEHMATFRALFHVFNTFVFLFGLANFGMGLWFRIDPKVYEIHKHIETQNFTIAGWILLFAGFLACMIAFVGFLASSRFSITLLLWYLFVIITLKLAFMSSIIMLTIYGLGWQLEMFLVKELYEQIRRRMMNTETNLFISNEAVQFLDFVQVKMRCCGAADFRDYQKLGMVIPTTCYTLAGNYVNAPGCGKAIRRLMDIRAGMAIGFSTGSVVSHLAASLTCALMVCSIYNWRTTPARYQSASQLRVR